ncbi:MAG: transglutaminase family protein [Kiritimatiellae bacterium]|nr:transglutaminase family protein [Kiritimatiellia bacterium]
MARRMHSEHKDPLSGAIGAIAKFFGAALFGGFVSIVFIMSAFWLEMDFLWNRPWVHIFWIIPVGWGGLGIFSFDPMLNGLRLAIVLLLPVCLGGVLCAEEARTWLSTGGTSIEAEWVRTEGKEVILKTPRGKLVHVALNRLCKADRDFVGGKHRTSPPDGGNLPGLIASLNGPERLVEKADLPRRIAIAALQQGKGEAMREVLGRWIAQEYRRRASVLLNTKIQILARGANTATCLGHLCGLDIAPEVVSWLLSDDERLSTIADALAEGDAAAEFARIVSALYAHDPRARDRFFRLIVAMGVVWDQPRPMMHGQMGTAGIPHEPDILDRYDHFRAAYSSASGKALFDRLSVVALCFVVDTPVPVSELSWAARNVHGNTSSWERKFAEIRYDRGRLDSGTYVWPHGPYTLEAIEERGGICVDQAYYATLTARAHGLPAIYFCGPGRRGGHAWFAYLKGKTNWALDVGRYTYDKYATGYATDPRTNRRMTDHDVAYTCEYALRSRDYAMAHAYVRVAEVLLEHGDFKAAQECAQAARARAPRYEEPWEIEIASYQKQGALDALLRVLEEKAKRFSKYPDIATRARTRQAEVLRRLGRGDESAKLLARQARRVGEDRDDLAAQILRQQVVQLEDGGDTKGARKEMEDLLEEQIGEGQKLLPLIGRYLTLTARTDQTHEAARFMKRFIRDCLQRYGSSEKNQQLFLSYLLRAHENDGDDSAARKVQRDLDRLSE